jgi:hypothetical protein
LSEHVLVCASCGEPIDGAVYGGPERKPVHLYCPLPVACPLCGRDLLEDGYLSLAGEAWHLACIAPAASFESGAESLPSALRCSVSRVSSCTGLKSAPCR